MAGIFLGDLLLRTWRLSALAVALIIGMTVIIIMATPLRLELKAGISTGLILGLLLSVTASPAVDGPQPADG